MSLVDFLRELDEEVQAVNSSDFEVEIIETNFVPSFSDTNITYDNLDTQKKKCKRLESCVLYVDIRGSAKISAERKPKTLEAVDLCTYFAQQCIGSHIITNANATLLA